MNKLRRFFQAPPCSSLLQRSKVLNRFPLPEVVTHRFPLILVYRYRFRAKARKNRMILMHFSPAFLVFQSIKTRALCLPFFSYDQPPLQGQDLLAEGLVQTWGP